MNGLNIEISNLTIILNVILRVVTAIVFLTFIIPLQFREAQVQNGLRKLRYELLITGIIIFLINSIGLIIIVFRFWGVNVTTITDIVSYFNSFGFLFIAIVEYQIYHYRYTPEQKELHSKFHKMELEEEEKMQKKLTSNRKHK